MNSFRFCLLGDAEANVKRSLGLLSELVAVLLVAFTAAAQTPPVPAAHSGRTLVPVEHVANLGTLKLQLQRYYVCTCTCGCYAKELDHQDQLAIDFLDRRARQPAHAGKLAVVLDIDETALTNYQEMAGADYGYNSTDFNAWVLTAQAPAIPGTLRLYREATRLGVSVFFITGRKDTQRAATEQNLKSAGYTGWQGLILRSPSQAKEATIAFKSEARQTIVDAGYRIILSVGDQFSDLTGKPAAELSVKLPNPFYYIP
jgi:acid phosphatase